eukprot:TRINITY_DN3570_c0_g1_i1.p1 TRINITY_DN3570_c0_g1~~TRINITY_DN3570_c0_g1_i1.p1  ORF type:complete len:274 (-),score=111.78 TRINITY_DN3570_c0_g1_i1:4-825(-)
MRNNLFKTINNNLQKTNKFYHQTHLKDYSNFCKDLKTIPEGEKFTTSFRTFLTQNNKKISFWHDIPLFNNDTTLNFICEIPKGTNAKMEMAKEEIYNPIKQDLSKGELRFLKHGNKICNYGFFPRTWEDPNVIDSLTNLYGDDDPLDVIEIGNNVIQLGKIKPVRVLGAMALIDQGQTDWKILAIDIDDEHADFILDFNDIEKYKPGLLKSLIEWYRVYKIAEGKSENKYALNGEILTTVETESLIALAYKYWELNFPKHSINDQKENDFLPQ